MDSLPAIHQIHIDTAVQRQTPENTTGVFPLHLMLSEDFQHKLELVVECLLMLAEKLEAIRVEIKDKLQKVGQRLTLVEGRLAAKIDAVAADLTAHRKVLRRTTECTWLRRETNNL